MNLEGEINHTQYLGMIDCVKFATNWKTNNIFFWGIPCLLMKEINILNLIVYKEKACTKQLNTWGLRKKMKLKD